MLRRYYDRRCAASYTCRPQPLGIHFTAGLQAGYYNDLTGKADFSGPTTAGGTPLSMASDGVLVDMPGDVFQMALGLHDRWLLRGDPSDRERFLRLADLAISQGHRTSYGLVWLYDFDWPIFGLRRPWICGMAQGQAVSVFVRAYQLTDRSDYLHVAREAAGPFETEVESGGVGRTTQFGWWLEEYPSTPPSLVLNGAIFAVWSLHDLGRVGDDGAARRFRALSESIAAALPAFDVGGWSRYDLYPAVVLPNLSSPFYHRLHVAQLDAMWRLTGMAEFANYRDRWARADGSPTKSSAAIVYKAAVRAERLVRRFAVSRAPLRSAP